MELTNTDRQLIVDSLKRTQKLMIQRQKSRHGKFEGVNQQILKENVAYYTKTYNELIQKFEVSP